MTWFPGPTADEERAEALHNLPVSGVAATPWRHNGPMLRIVFSVLTVLAVAALFGFFALFRLPKGVVAAAIAIGTAEMLIRRYRFFGTGLEAALWISGTFAFIFGLPSTGSVEAVLVFALAAAFSGWRMRNAFFGLLAAILVIVYVAIKGEHVQALPLIVAAILTIAAAAALRRNWRRPSTERLFAHAVLALPLTGYIATATRRIFDSGAYVPNIPVAAILVVTALVLFGAGIVCCDRVLLAAGGIGFVLAAVELNELLDIAMEWKLIAGGVVVIVIATSLSRALRGATRGFVVTPVRAGVYDEAMQIGGIIALAPHGSAPATHDGGPHLTDSAGPTDKSFGGAGAGGGF